MRKIVLLLTTLLILLTGCSGSAYETYSKALEKTEGVSSGKTKMTQEAHVEFNTEGLDKKVLEELRKWEKFNVDMELTFDKEQEIGVTNIYGELYDLGIEGKLYNQKNNLYLVTPLLPKILVLTGGDLQGEEIEKLEEQFLIKDFKDFEKMWKEVIDRENISKLGNIIISTPEGDIKAKEFHITLTKEDIMPLMIEGTKMFNQIMVEQMKANNISVDPKEMEEQFKNAIEEIDFEKIYHRAYIDKDGFVVEEETHLIINFPSTKEGHIKRIDFKGKVQNWDLGKQVKVTIPELTDENTMTIEELKESGFNKKFKGGA